MADNQFLDHNMKKALLPSYSFYTLHSALELCSLGDQSKGAFQLLKPEFDNKFHSDRLETLEFKEKRRSNSGLFRDVLTKKSSFYW